MSCGDRPKGIEVQLDRLVDGEMPPDEYRSFVQSLDGLGDGWKRCAMAFLEAQAWRQDVPAFRVAESAATAVAVPLAPSWWRATGRWAALAATLLMAFTCGLWFSRPEWELPHQFDPFQPNTGLQALPMLTSSPPNMRAASQELMTSRGGIGNARSGRDPRPEEVEFVVSGNDVDWRDATKLPVVSLDERNNGQLSDDFWSTPQVVELLRRSGREVERRQQMVPFVLSDGRPVLMPVERVEVKPVKLPAY